jgi:hypothetical protein
MKRNGVVLLQNTMLGLPTDNAEGTMMSLRQETKDHAKWAAALVGWGALLGIAFWAAPYLYAVNDLIQWR